jgi:hypothetical protein
MGVIERIRQIQEQQARKATEAEAARLEEYKKGEPARLAAAEAQRQKEAEKKNRNEKMIRETGVLEKLQQIEKEFLGRTRHRLFTSWGVDIKSTSAGGAGGVNYYNEINCDRINYKLAWGYQKDQEKKDRIDGYDYSSIEVSLELDSGKITFWGCQPIEKNEWQNNKSVIDEAVANAYLNPNKNVRPAPDDRWSLN